MLIQSDEVLAELFRAVGFKMTTSTISEFRTAKAKVDHIADTVADLNQFVDPKRFFWKLQGTQNWELIASGFKLAMIEVPRSADHLARAFCDASWLGKVNDRQLIWGLTLGLFEGCVAVDWCLATDDPERNCNRFRPDWARAQTALERAVQQLMLDLLKRKVYGLQLTVELASKKIDKRWKERLSKAVKAFCRPAQHGRHDVDCFGRRLELNKAIIREAYEWIEQNKLRGEIDGDQPVESYPDLPEFVEELFRQLGYGIEWSATTIVKMTALLWGFDKKEASEQES